MGEYKLQEKPENHNHNNQGKDYKYVERVGHDSLLLAFIFCTGKLYHRGFAFIKQEVRVIKKLLHNSSYLPVCVGCSAKVHHPVP